MSAIGDFYTWRLASRIYGEDTTGAWTTVRVKCFRMSRWGCAGYSSYSSPTNELTAICHHSKSLAMVLLDENFVELLGNNTHHCRVRALAMAVVSGPCSR